jgi:chloramphenicol 3-O phosphotransferase
MRSSTGYPRRSATKARPEPIRVPGPIVILNGAPRSGKSSIAAAMGEGWVNLGVDAWMKATPPHLLPGIGLRPGGERPDLEDFVRESYAALYDAIAAESRKGINVVVDVGHHDSYSRPLHVLRDSARRLSSLPVLFVGVRCPVETIMARRNAGGGYVKGTAEDPVPAPVQRWQDAVHAHGLYDLEIDTSKRTPAECAAVIRAALDAGAQKQTAFQLLAERP